MPIFEGAGTNFFILAVCSLFPARVFGQVRVGSYWSKLVGHAFFDPFVHIDFYDVAVLRSRWKITRCFEPIFWIFIVDVLLVLINYVVVYKIREDYRAGHFFLAVS